jgi:hypothetical protein
MNIKFSTVLIAIIFSAIAVSAQDKCPVKFGHITPQDFDISPYHVDTSANGVIIADVGYSTFETNSNGGFSLLFKHQRRLKIINKNGFDLANVVIPLYFKDGRGEQLESLEAATYNLEDGKVVKTKLSNDAVFDVKEQKNYIKKKFTMPALKEGSIVEYSYTIKSDYIFNFQSWLFQGDYPRIWSEYEADIPEFFKYVILAQGYEAFYKKTEVTHAESYTVHSATDITNTTTLNGNAIDHKWVMRNVPALKEEKFTTSINNFIAKIEFQLSSVQFPDQFPRDYMGTWDGTSDDLLKSADFGDALDKNNGWLADDIKFITAGTTTDIEKARNIYYYVKSNIKCSTDENDIWLNKSLKDVFKTKSGNVADVNLLLVAMLRHENLLADPVILSTTENGYTSPYYPKISKFNYVICQLQVQGKTYYLDATKSYLGFGKLCADNYNGHARVINKEATPVYFMADSLKEKKMSIATITFDSAKWVCSLESDPGYCESSDIREKISDKGKDEYITKIKSMYTDNASVTDIKFKDLDSSEKPLQLSYKIAIDGDPSSNIIYFDPMLKEGHDENYFKSAVRKYPVEMPYSIDETYVMNLFIPKGYVVDELPQSTKVLFKNEDEGFFEYRIAQTTSTTVSLCSHIKLAHAIFTPADYETLRDFFDVVVKKQSEQIVFKKKTP